MMRVWRKVGLRTFAALAGMAGLAAAVTTHAMEVPPRPDVLKEIRQCVAGLESSDRAVRDKALKGLVQAGEAAVPILRQALYHREAQVRRSADEALAMIRVGAVWNRKVREKLKTKAVTISVKDAPLGQVLSELAEKGDLELALSPPLQRAMQEDPMPVSLEVKDYNLGLALTAVLEAKKLTCSLAYDGVVVEGGEGVRSRMLALALSEKVPPLKLKEATLQAAVDTLKPSLFLGLALDREVLTKDAEKRYAVNVTTERPLRLETVLSLMLEGHDLGFVFDERRILITSKAKAADERATVEYDVGDLLTCMRERHAQENPAGQVMEAIRESVDRLAWMGDKAAIRMDGQKLVIHQRRSVQGRIEQFLKTVEKFEGVRHGEVGEVLEF